MIALLLLTGCSSGHSDPDGHSPGRDDSVHDGDTDTGPGDTDTGPGDTDTGPPPPPDPCDELGPDDPCCIQSGDLLVPFTWPEADGVAGTFTAGESGTDDQEWLLTAQDGSTSTVYFYWDGAGGDLAPDLAALGEVVVTGSGQSLDGEGFSGFPTLVITGPAGDLLFAIGTTSSDTTPVEVAIDTDVCPDRPPGAADDSLAHCFETVAIEALLFTDDSTSLTLYQGESGELTTATVTVLMAMARGEPTYSCSDVIGNFTNWVVVGTPR